MPRSGAGGHWSWGISQLPYVECRADVIGLFCMNYRLTSHQKLKTLPLRYLFETVLAM